MTVENYRLGQAPSSQVPDDYGVQTAPGDLGAVQRAVQRRRVLGEVLVPPQNFPDDPQNLDDRVTDYWRNKGYSALWNAATLEPLVHEFCC